MSRILLNLSIFLLCGVLQAQHETLFNNLDVTGAFGSLIIETGEINAEVGADVGGGAALVMSPLFIGWYGMGTKYPTHTIEEGDYAGDYNIKFKHHGLWLGFVPRSDKLIHFYGSAKIGWGKTHLRQDRDKILTDRTFVMTPELGFELNLTQYVKMTFTGGYRWVNGISQLPGLTNDDFSSPIGTITFRMGGFIDDF